MGADGGKVMAEYVQQALKQCPGTKIIVSGYSQGGMVVHNAFSNGVSASDVAGAIMFGDPFKRQALPGLSSDKVKQTLLLLSPSRQLVLLKCRINVED
jgi:cutinase